MKEKHWTPEKEINRETVGIGSWSTYEERNVEIHEEYLAELVEKSGQRIVPVVEIENRIINGLDVKSIEELIQKPGG